MVMRASGVHMPRSDVGVPVDSFGRETYEFVYTGISEHLAACRLAPVIVVADT